MRLSRLWLVAGACLLCGVGNRCYAAAVESVTTLDLSGDWDFAYRAPATVKTQPTQAYINDDSKRGEWVDAPVAAAMDVPPRSAFRTEMPVPGCWDDRFDRQQATTLWPEAKFNPSPPTAVAAASQLDGSLPFLVGTGWYRRSIDVPAEWRDRQIALHVGRVVMEAWVYVNGRMIAHHLGPSTDFEVSLTGKVELGRPNELLIAVDNTRINRIGSQIRGYAGRSGGIFGPVSLRVARSTRIMDVYVYPEAGQLQWRIELEGALDSQCNLHWKISDPQTGRSLSAGQQAANDSSVRWSSPAPGFRYWSDMHPSMYRLDIELKSSRGYLDQWRQPFGMRRLTRAGKGLLLNESPIFLRGVCDIAYYPMTCTPPGDVAWYREHIRRLKELGFNWIRCHTWVPGEPYLQAADELGMLIQVEPPKGYAMPEWRDILRACRKHPSAVIYCCGNEELLDEPKIEFLRQCAAETRQLAPDALFNSQEALRGVEYGFQGAGQVDQMGQDVVLKPYPHNPTRLAKLSEFSDVFGQFTWGMLSYGSLSGEAKLIDARLADYKPACLAHEVGICGCYLDLRLEQRYEGTRIGTDLYRAVRESLAKAGLLDRAGVYYRNSAAWQRLMLKDAMETARHCRSLAGYDYLGANDSHWHRTGYGCGVLNEFDELKAGRSVEDILSYNGPSVLLVSKQKERNVVAGQPLEREISVSWFGESGLRGALLNWSLVTGDSLVLARGQQTVARSDAGTVERLAAISAPTQHSDRPTKVTLTVELLHSSGQLRNSWDYWLFPAGDLTAPKNVSVVSELDGAVVSKLSSGARVVLLGSKPFATRPLSFQMGVAGRPDRNLATVIAKHPLMDDFPHEGYCDFQFIKMMEGAAAVQFDAMAETFSPVIEVVSSYKQIRRQAALFEWRVGEGRLLVCSLQLPDSDPAAAWFHRQLLAYAAGEKFLPRTHVSPEQLERLLQHPSATKPAEAKTDEGFDRRGQLPQWKGR